MHELSVCQALISQVEEIAAEHHAITVTNIVIEMGPLSGVVPELLQRAYPMASVGTVAKDATLTINKSAVRVQCKSCQAETEATTNRLVCGKCGDWQTQIISGDELLLAHIELEKPTTADHQLH